MSSTKVITGKVRFSYANVFEPKSINGSEPKYSCAILIDKKDKKTLAKIEAAIAAATEEGKAKFGGKVPKKLKTPLRDGDEEREDEAYEGMMFLNANSKTRPGVVDEDVNPILDQDEFYSGCYGRASLNFFAFNTNGNAGIAVGLNNLQKLEEGDRLSGGASAEEDFGSMEEDDLM